MNNFSLGVLLWAQATSWEDLKAAAVRADHLGYDHVWFYDHLYAINSREPYIPTFDGWMVLGGLGTITHQARLGLLVGANTFRNPGLVAKMATTLDHMTGGRAIVGLGGAWNQLEHNAFGIEFGASPGQRLDWLEEATSSIKVLLAGKPVTSTPGSFYRFFDARIEPSPLQKSVPIMIGGAGETKTLRTVARHADMWNLFGSPERLASKDAVLQRHCDEVGRDPMSIERTVSAKVVLRDSGEDAREVWSKQMVNNRCPEDDWDDATELWLGSPRMIADEILRRREVGFHTFIAMLATPIDYETLDRLIGEVKPLVDAG